MVYALAKGVEASFDEGERGDCRQGGEAYGGVAEGVGVESGSFCQRRAHHACHGHGREGAEPEGEADRHED